VFFHFSSAVTMSSDFVDFAAVIASSNARIAIQPDQVLSDGGWLYFFWNNSVIAFSAAVFLGLL
jgi:hypothetical protein